MAIKGEKPREIGDISSLDNKTWLKWRQHGAHYDDPLHPEYIPVTVTGSESAMVMGWSTFGSNMDLYALKTNMQLKSPEDKSKKQEIFDAGHIFEPFVAVQFLRYMKKEFPNVKIKMEKDIIWEFFTTLQSLYPSLKKPAATALVDGIRKIVNKTFKYNPNMMYQCGRKNPDGSLMYPFAVVNTDGFLNIDGKYAVLECKTTKDYNTIEEFKNGICPAKYEAQCRHTMAVMNLDAVYIVCCWGWTLSEMAVVCVTRDMQLEEEMMKEEKTFCECVEIGVEPSPENQRPDLLSKFRVKLYGEPKKDVPPVELPETCREAVLKAVLAEEKYAKCAENLAAAEREKEEVLAEIYSYYKTAEYASFRINEEDVAGIKLKVPMHKAKLDEERLKKEEPALYAKYETTSFDAAKFGKENKLLKYKYTIPATPNVDKKPSYELKLRKIPAV